MHELWRLSATEIAAKIQSGTVSAVQVTTSALARLTAINPVINAVVDTCEDDAMASAHSLDTAIAQGHKPGPLAGVPVTVKVNIDQAGYATTNGLVLQKDRIASEDSPVVTNLRNAGAIIIGRTNTPAFSLRWFTRNSLHGATRNPINPSLTPGGSSGGAAASVASGIGSIAHGTDIAGSIRYPAYACGVHGLRPSMGRVATYNASGPDRYIAGQMMSVSGPIARTISDLRLALLAMSAASLRDPWWIPVSDDLPNVSRRVAMCIAPDALDVDPAIEQALRSTASILSDAGYEVSEIACPSFRQAAQLNLNLWMAEMKRAGTEIIKQENDPDALFIFEQIQRHAAMYDANALLDAMQTRVTLIRQWQEFLNQYPIVLCPVSAGLPFDDHSDVESEDSFDQIIEAQLLQVGLPLTGLPGLTVTTGAVGNKPVGVQLIASRFREDLLLEAGQVIENANGEIAAIDPAR